MSVTILILDDHAMFRGGLRVLLKQEEDFEIVGESDSGRQALTLLENARVDVLLLDISINGDLSAAQTAEQALERHPNLAIVVLTMHEDEYYFREMLRIGVMGFVLKKSDPNDLIRAIRSACRGDHFVDPNVSRHLVADITGKPAGHPPTRVDVLSQREVEVCRFLALGYTNNEVGRLLYISERTVESHRSRIMKKLDLESRAELVRFAIDNAILTIP